jgi:hypothetical protein
VILFSSPYLSQAPPISFIFFLRKINKAITNNPQEIAKNVIFVACLLLTKLSETKNYNSNPRDEVNASNYLINKFNTTFVRISLTNATAYEIDKIIKT